MSATVTVLPTSGAYTVPPTAPMTEATGRLLLGGASQPYGADNFAVTARDADGNPTTIQYRQGATVVKTRTLTYVDGKLDTSTDA